MPFDLERTTHQFTKTATGGVQTVVADDPQDTTQVTLILQHLTAEVDRFRRGDFADPAAIHGNQMPGLQALRAHGGRITIDYQTTSDGGHHWFDAQVNDHGAHATG